MENNTLSPGKIDRNSEWFNYRLTSARYLVQDKRKLIPLILLAIALLFGILAVAKVTGLFIASARAQRIVRQAAAWSKPDREEVDSQIAKSKLMADNLKENNLFWPTPKENPVKAVLGIFGDEAYINGQWYKAGAKIGDAKILAIDADSVTTEWNGQKTVFRPIDAGGPPGPGGPMPGPEGPAPGPAAAGGKRPGMVVVHPDAPPMPGPQARRPDIKVGPKLSEEDIAKMKERMEMVKKR
jgi:hypothetical protein